MGRKPPAALDPSNGCLGRSRGDLRVVWSGLDQVILVWSFGFVPQPSGGGSSDTPETTLPCFLDRREDEEEQSEAAQRLTVGVS